MKRIMNLAIVLAMCATFVGIGAAVGSAEPGRVSMSIDEAGIRGMGLGGDNVWANAWPYPPLFGHWCATTSPSGEIGVAIIVWDQATGEPVSGIPAENVKAYPAYPGFYLCEDMEEYETNPEFHWTAVEPTGFDPAYPGLTYFQVAAGGCSFWAIEIDDPVYQGVSFIDVKSPDVTDGGPTDTPDGMVNLSDFSRFSQYMDRQDACGDFTCDGDVTVQDFNLFLQQFLKSCPN